MTRSIFRLTAAAVALAAAPLSAQNVTSAVTANDPSGGTHDTAKAAPAAAKAALVSPIEVQHYRPLDSRGINVFEPPKSDTTPFTGFKLSWGAAFAQQFQALDHKNTADPKVVNDV